MFADLRTEELRSLQNLAKTSTHLLWVTAGGLISGQNPGHAMISGLARCLRSETSSLKLITVDFDLGSNSLKQMRDTILRLADKQMDAERTLEAEYSVHEGKIYTSRLAPCNDFGKASALTADLTQKLFNPDGMYLLVGCLGGLGRSLTSWMIDHGARHLAFMARSGVDRPAAANLVSSIQSRGIEVTILRGDVTNKDDVESAVHIITKHRQLLGVVNAAMVLNVGLVVSHIS